MARKYITTAIDFPNAAPHMGHVYEKILADVIARWWRLSGHEVRFHLGTDENGIKIQQTAESLKMTPKELVERNAPMFEQLFRSLNISFDYFIRTADPKSHWPTVTELWKRLQAKGFLEKRSYAGLYCTGCERFVTGKDLIDGKCPDHNREPEKVTEENWFFLLSKKEDDVKKLLDPKKGSYHIVPEWRANETTTFLAGGLEDVSFSRSKEKLYWGVPVPGDEAQVMYVWCDNLTSYISSLGFFTDHEESQWWNDAEVTHVIGKDIARFHAINWPAMLQVADVKTPDRLLIHGFITSEGQKMSKSLGNVVDPNEVITKYGVDALRFFLTSEIPVGNDGDFSWKRFGEIYQSKLGNQLGNLLNRVMVLLNKDGGVLQVPPEGKNDMSVKKAGKAPAWLQYEKEMDAFQLQNAVAVPIVTVMQANGDINVLKPWSMTDAQERIACLSGLAEDLRHVALMFLPFIPETAQKISAQLGVPYAGHMLDKDFVITDAMKTWGGCKDWKQIGEPSILFPKVEIA